MPDVNGWELVIGEIERARVVNIGCAPRLAEGRAALGAMGCKLFSSAILHKRLNAGGSGAVSASDSKVASLSVPLPGCPHPAPVGPARSNSSA